MMHGKGKYEWKNGIVFAGDFEDNNITGSGTYVWVDGRYVHIPCSFHFFFGIR